MIQLCLQLDLDKKAHLTYIDKKATRLLYHFRLMHQIDSLLRPNQFHNVICKIKHIVYIKV